MIRNYRDLTRLEMEQVDKKETIILIPLGALEQHGNQAPLGTDDIIAEAMVKYLGEELEAVGEKDFPILAFPVIPVGLSIRTSVVRSLLNRIRIIICSMISVSVWHITDSRRLLFWYAMAEMHRWCRS